MSKILNPLTGRMVLRTGKIGQSILKAAGKPTKKAKTSAKKASAKKASAKKASVKKPSAKKASSSTKQTEESRLFEKHILAAVNDKNVAQFRQLMLGNIHLLNRTALSNPILPKLWEIVARNNDDVMIAELVDRDFPPYWEPFARYGRYELMMSTRATGFGHSDALMTAIRRGDRRIVDALVNSELKFKYEHPHFLEIVNNQMSWRVASLFKRAVKLATDLESAASGKKRDEYRAIRKMLVKSSTQRLTSIR